MLLRLLSLRIRFRWYIITPAVIFNLLAIYLSVFGYVTTYTIPKSAVSKVGPYAYVVDIPYNPRVWAPAADSSRNPRKSNARLLQDGSELGPPHSVHATIGSIGYGRFSLWGAAYDTALYFSASDNTDPRINAREYRIEYTRKLAPRFLFISILVSLLLAAVLWYRKIAAPDKKLGFGGPLTAQIQSEIQSALHKMQSQPQLIGLLVLASILAGMLLWGTGSSAWILFGFPSKDHFSNTILGYSYLLPDGIIHKENWVFYEHVVGVFSGYYKEYGTYPINFYIKRGFYGFAASLLFPLMELGHAFILVNLICYIVSVAVTWKLTLAMTHRREASWIAALLTIGGLGYVSHLGDISAHLISFTTYYLGVYLIYRSRVHVESRPLGEHIGLGAYLSIAALTYSNAFYLVGAYLLLALRKNKWTRVIPVAIALPLMARWIWVRLLEGLGITTADVEYVQLGWSLSHWKDVFLEGALAVFIKLAYKLSEFLLFESPLVIVAGLIGIVALKREDKIFFVTLFAIPFIMVMPWSLGTSPRGYLVYGSSLLLFASSGALVYYLYNQAQPKLRVLASVLVLALFVTHYSWNFSYILFGNIGPVKTYFLGWDDGFPTFGSGKPEILNLTEPDKAISMGRLSASLDRTGSYYIGGNVKVAPESISVWRAIAVKSLFFIYIAVAVAFLLRGKRRWLLLSVLFAAIVLPAYVLKQEGIDIPGPFKFEVAISNPPRQILRYSVTVTEEFIQALENRAESGDSVVLAGFLNNGVMEAYRNIRGEERKVKIIPDSFMWDRPSWLTIKPDRLLRILRANPTMDFEFVAGEQEQKIHGWQRNGSPGRHFSSEYAVVPALEFRLMTENGMTKLLGF